MPCKDTIWQKPTRNLHVRTSAILYADFYQAALKDPLSNSALSRPFIKCSDGQPTVVSG